MINYQETQIQTILNHLVSGRPISKFCSEQLYGIVCLPQRIHELRRKGYSIEGRMVRHENLTFKLYRMPEYCTLPTSLVTGEVISYDNI